MKILIHIYNIIIRLFTGIIPSRALRRKIREQYVYTQICPRGARYYVVKNGKKVNQNFIKFGLHISVYGTGNEIIIDESAIFSNAHLTIRGNNNTFRLGKNTSACNATFHLYGNNQLMSIGEDCMFSYDVEIWNGDAHAIFKKNEKIPYNISKDLIIGNHVWLGAYSKVLKGAKIPDNSIVAMDALVTSSFSQPNIILAGSPAKIVKENIAWDRKEPEEFLCS